MAMRHHMRISPSPKPPEFSDPCARETSGKWCDRKKCGHVHWDQVDLYAAVIAILKSPNKKAKDAAEAAETEMGEAMEM